MIHRQNYLDARAFLHYTEHVRQKEPTTVSRYRNALRHLLEWADETPFARARALDPTFPQYLLTARADEKTIPLAPVTIHKTLMTARHFFAYARDEWTLRYKPITASWIETLQPPRQVRLHSRLPIRQLWTLDDVRKVMTVSTATRREERGKVALAMLFLSGMRADALASLPIHCVDLPARRISQLPEFGVRTKGRTAALTTLLRLDDLLAVCHAWHAQLLAAQLSPQSLWYATLSRDGMSLTETHTAHVGRYHAIEDDLKLICAKAGVPYKSPHKVRHGHSVYALKKARNMAELKAISQNIMHASVVTTDSIYGRLVQDDVHEIISNL